MTTHIMFYVYTCDGTMDPRIFVFYSVDKILLGKK
jgi:hypothetical protein